MGVVLVLVIPLIILPSITVADEVPAPVTLIPVMVEVSADVVIPPMVLLRILDPFAEVLRDIPVAVPPVILIELETLVLPMTFPLVVPMLIKLAPVADIPVNAPVLVVMVVMVLLSTTLGVPDPGTLADIPVKALEDVPQLIFLMVLLETVLLLPAVAAVREIPVNAPVLPAVAPMLAMVLLDTALLPTADARDIPVILPVLAAVVLIELAVEASPMIFPLAAPRLVIPMFTNPAPTLIPVNPALVVPDRLKLPMVLPVISVAAEVAALRLIPVETAPALLFQYPLENEVPPPMKLPLMIFPLPADARLMAFCAMAAVIVPLWMVLLEMVLELLDALFE